jgi:hypothetical protein
MCSNPAASYAEVLRRIQSAAARYGRNAPDITLIAVSKTFEAPAILPVLEAGHADFGENRVQEAKAKWPALRERFPHVCLHLIGPLQTNKVADAVRLFDCIHTLDRPSLAQSLAREIGKQGKQPQLFVQVNTGGEVQKAGVSLPEADAFLTACRNTYGLKPVGLMCIPPVEDAPEPHFTLLADMARRNGLTKLSIGMSADFEAAIACGATHVRVGSSIFGAR